MVEANAPRGETHQPMTIPSMDTNPLVKGGAARRERPDPIGCGTTGLYRAGMAGVAPADAGVSRASLGEVCASATSQVCGLPRKMRGKAGRMPAIPGERADPKGARVAERRVSIARVWRASRPLMRAARAHHSPRVGGDDGWWLKAQQRGGRCGDVCPFELSFERFGISVIVLSDNRCPA